MITTEEFLKAKKVISDYKNQKKVKTNRLTKVDLYLKKSDKEIIESMKQYTEKNKILRYTKSVELISESYFSFFDKKLGTNNLKIILSKLIERNVFIKSGDYKFQEYRLNI